MQPRPKEVVQQVTAREQVVRQVVACSSICSCYGRSCSASCERRQKPRRTPYSTSRAPIAKRSTDSCSGSSKRMSCSRCSQQMSQMSTRSPPTSSRVPLLYSGAGLRSPVRSVRPHRRSRPLQSLPLCLPHPHLQSTQPSSELAPGAWRWRVARVSTKAERSSRRNRKANRPSRRRGSLRSHRLSARHSRQKLKTWTRQRIGSGASERVYE